MSRVLLALGWVVAAAMPWASAEVVDQTLATVGDEVILQSDVLAEIAPDLNDLRNQVAGDEFNRRLDELIRAGLKQAVEEKLLLREAKQAGITVDEKDVQKRFDEFKQRYPSTEAFLKDLELYGETQTDLRNSFRDRLMALRMAARKIDELSKQVVVSESEVAQYYQDHPEEFLQQESVRVRQIFLPVEAGENAAVVRARLEQLKEELEAGADFAELAKAHSKGPSAAEGGIVGWVERGDLEEALDAAAFSLQPGQVSDIIETAHGLHLLKVEERRDAGSIPLEQARAVIEPRLRAQAAQERYEKWMNELRQRSNVQIFL